MMAQAEIDALFVDSHFHTIPWDRDRIVVTGVLVGPGWLDGQTWATEDSDANVSAGHDQHATNATG